MAAARLHFPMDIWPRGLGSTRIKTLLAGSLSAGMWARRHEVAKLRSRVEELSASLPVVLNVIDTANAGARSRERRLRELESRIETLEAHPTVRSRRDARGTRLRTGTPARLVLGFQRQSRDGYIAVDDAPSPGLDLVADMRALPFEDASIDEIRAEHVVERFGRDELRFDVLPHWYRLLRPGGHLVTVSTDDGSVFRDAVAGRRSLDEVEKEVFTHRRRGSVFTSSSLAELLGESGFVEVDVKETTPEAESCPILHGHAVRPAE
jgi:SAM-dependent methyltransferase